MDNPWIKHVKDFAAKNKISYTEALKHPDIKKGYSKSTSGKIYEYPAELEKEYSVRYSNTPGGSADNFVEDTKGEFMFKTLKKAKALYDKTIKNKNYMFATNISLVQSLAPDEDGEFNEDYPEHIVIEETSR